MNIKEIAERAGVSRTTVSRYLNGGYVSEEKREQIKKVIEETGYRPASQAQALRTKKTQLVGVILPKINSESVGRMVAGISVVLREKGYQLLLGNTANDIEEELKYLELFKENRVDGVIFIATIFTKRHSQLLRECKVPVVILGQRLEGYSCVYHDDYNAAKELTGLLLEAGSRPAYIGVTVRDEAAGLNRRKGFEEAVREKGLECPASRMEEASFNVESGREKMRVLLKSAPDLDCVFCATDSIAAGAMLCLKEAGYRIPQDVRIAGMGDTQLSILLSPNLATVHFYYKTSGEEAARMLVKKMEDMETAVGELKMGYEIKKNASI